MVPASARIVEKARRKKLHAPSVLAIVAGAVAIGFAPVLVRFSETGPTATAFWRIFLALPLLAGWRLSERDLKTWPIKTWWWLIACALVFAGDLAVWHQSIKFTTVANATLFANFAPIFVVIFGFLFLRERVSARFLVAMIAALAGTLLLVGGNLRDERSRLYGDLLGLLTAGFYAGYLQSVKKLRGWISSAAIMLWSAVVSAPVLYLVTLAAHEKLMPASVRGWVVLALLAVISHVGGQGLIAFALARLPVAFSSLVLLVQPIVAATASAFLLREKLGLLQIAGGALVLIGILFAWRESQTDRNN